MVEITGHFDGKVIVLDEPAGDLPRNQKLILRIEKASGPPAVEPGSSLRWMAENAIDDPSLPEDGSYQHAHYVHGTPKKP